MLLTSNGITTKISVEQIIINIKYLLKIQRNHYHEFQSNLQYFKLDLLDI